MIWKGERERGRERERENMVLLFYTSIHSNRLQYLMVWHALRTSFSFASMASTATPSGFSSAADMVWESCFNLLSLLFFFHVEGKKKS